MINVEDQPGEEEHPDRGSHSSEQEEGGEEAEDSKGKTNSKKTRS